MFVATEAPWYGLHHAWAVGLSFTNREESRTLCDRTTLIRARRKAVLGLTFVQQVKSDIGWELLTEGVKS